MDATMVLTEKLWLALGTAPWLSQLPKLRSQASKAIVSVWKTKQNKNKQISISFDLAGTLLLTAEGSGRPYNVFQLISIKEYFAGHPANVRVSESIPVDSRS